jgi:hypothetical protein
MSRREYREVYLASDAWQSLRETILSAKPACERCDKPATNVHHLVYRDDVESAKVTDLMPLCRRCHDQIHRAIKLRLIPDPSRIKPKQAENASVVSKAITDKEITAKQSHNQTKRILSADEYKTINELHPHAKKRCMGILKCLSQHLNTTRFTNKRIEMAMGFVGSVSTDRGLNRFVSSEGDKARRARRKQNRRKR